MYRKVGPKNAYRTGTLTDMCEAMADERLKVEKKDSARHP